MRTTDAERLIRDLTDVSQVTVDRSGMRPGSLDLVRKQRLAGVRSRPIEVDVYPDVGFILADGRHRLAVAQELGDREIEAVVRVYDSEGNVVAKIQKTLSIS